MTIWIGCQSPHLVARYTSLAFGLPQEAIRVIAKDVGGGFGLKNFPWREEIAVIAAARLFRRPLKWIEDRFESLTASSHAREQEMTLTVAFDAEGRMVGGFGDYSSNNGAWPMGEDCNMAVHMFMWPAYKMPAYGFVTRGWYTNTMGLGGYRGPWAMELLVREVLLDDAARLIGIDPIEIRRRNLVTLSDQPVTSTVRHRSQRHHAGRMPRKAARAVSTCRRSARNRPRRASRGAISASASPPISSRPRPPGRWRR